MQYCMPAVSLHKNLLYHKNDIHDYTLDWQARCSPQLISVDIKLYLVCPSASHLSLLNSPSGQKVESQGFDGYEFVSAWFIFGVIPYTDYIEANILTRPNVTTLYKSILTLCWFRMNDRKFWTSFQSMLWH